MRGGEEALRFADVCCCVCVPRRGGTSRVVGVEGALEEERGGENESYVWYIDVAHRRGPRGGESAVGFWRGGLRCGAPFHVAPKRI